MPTDTVVQFLWACDTSCRRTSNRIRNPITQKQLNEAPAVATCRHQPGARDVTMTSCTRHAVLVLPIERIAHLDNDQHGQCTGLGFGRVEYVTVDAWEHPGLRRALHVVCLTTW